jgi:ABC-type glycerol-3-phosphate transport system permease component
MRPLGVTLVGFYQVLRGVVALLFGLSILLSAGLAAKLVSLAAEGNAIERLLRNFGYAAGLVIIVFAIIDMLAGYGVLQMQNWGRLLTLLFSAIGLVLVLPGLARANISSCLFGVIDAACIIYLAMPAIRRAFHAGGNAVRAAA